MPARTGASGVRRPVIQVRACVSRQRLTSNALLVVSVQITLATLAMLSALALFLRVLRRGEAQVLPTAAPVPPAPAVPA